jgi:hypothetical protein
MALCFTGTGFGKGNSWSGSGLMCSWCGRHKLNLAAALCSRWGLRNWRECSLGGLEG